MDKEIYSGLQKWRQLNYKKVKKTRFYIEKREIWNSYLDPLGKEWLSFWVGKKKSNKKMK